MGCPNLASTNSKESSAHKLPFLYIVNFAEPDLNMTYICRTSLRNVSLKVPSMSISVDPLSVRNTRIVQSLHCPLILNLFSYFEQLNRKIAKMIIHVLFITLIYTNIRNVTQNSYKKWH